MRSSSATPTTSTPGFVGHRLRQHGYAFTECHREHPERWPALDGIDLVLTLGSEWNVYRPETAALVEAEAALVRDVVERDIPLLAICFGAQVLSHALGGTVSRTDRPEIGWFELADAGAAVAAGPWMEWHDDVFTVPEGFDVLATHRRRAAADPRRAHAWRRSSTPRPPRRWSRRWLGRGRRRAVPPHGGDPDELLAATRANVERSRPDAAALVDWFLDDVAALTPTRPWP